jgi:hypothetical protein
MSCFKAKHQCQTESTKKLPSNTKKQQKNFLRSSKEILLDFINSLSTSENRINIRQNEIFNLIYARPSPQQALLLKFSRVPKEILKYFFGNSRAFSIILNNYSDNKVHNHFLKIKRNSKVARKYFQELQTRKRLNDTLLFKLTQICIIKRHE